jgi:hypothetical protein
MLYLQLTMLSIKETCTDKKEGNTSAGALLL